MALFECGLLKSNKHNLFSASAQYVAICVHRHGRHRNFHRYSMTLKVLRESLPDYAKDLKLNLSTLLSETTLNDEQKGSTSFTRQANPTLK
jgi:hypothetical protein